MAKTLAFDRVLFATVVLATFVGLVMVYSASDPVARLQEGASTNPFVVKQSLAAVLGLVAMVTILHLDYRRLREPGVVYTMIGTVVVLLVAVLLVGPERNGTHRWFDLGPISIQPAELAKLALVPFLAYQLDRKEDRVNQRSLLVPVVAVTGVIVALILAQPDFGTGVLLAATAALLLFLAGLAWRWLVLAAAVGLPVVALLVFTTDYRRRRLLAFLDPEADPLGAGFQANQALIAVGSGGLTGLGPGSSVQKLHYLPHSYSDYIFAIVCEELGFVGAVALLSLFAIILWRGVLAGVRAPDALGRYLAFGFTGLLVMQALIHISVSLAMAPTKGIPLPFISYGGSSLVASLVACGVLLNVSQHG